MKNIKNIFLLKNNYFNISSLPIVLLLFFLVFCCSLLSAAANTLDSNEKNISLLDGQPDILIDGKSTNSVASEFGLTSDMLKQINQYSTFLSGTEYVVAGNEIDTPISVNQPQSGKKTQQFKTQDELTLHSVSPMSGNVTPLIMVGHTLMSPDPKSAVENYVNHMMVDNINKQAHEWLNKYGTARFNLNINNDFSLNESALDWLIPIYDSLPLTVFTQIGMRNNSHRNIINVGLGDRVLYGSWILGSNIFYDYDLTGNNHRLGLGAELFADDFKVSTNGYFRLSDWHQSYDWIDYDERPANGFDIRANTWLSSLPQLGGKLSYQQYMGDKVALFGKEHWQSNPYELTLGVNYTPIPLLTLEVNERIGKNGVTDTQFIAQLNYRLDEGWQSQFDSSRVSALRKIEKNRYDLVDRNNNIVFEYRNQELIKINTTDYIEGYQSEIGIIHIDVISKYDIKFFDWRGLSSFLLSGGSVKELDGNKLQITYPPYKEHGDNSYKIDVIAYDIKNNSSNLSSTIINVLNKTRHDVDDVLHRDLVVIQDNAKANGRDENIIRATVTDAEGNPQPNQTINFSADNGAILTKAQGVTDNAGVVITTLTNSTAGISHVSAQVNDELLTVETHFIADEATADILYNNLIVTNDNAKANGIESNAVQAKVTDANGNVLAGQVVQFSADNGAILTTVIGITGTDGLATATLVSRTSGVSNVTAQLSNGNQASVITNFSIYDELTGIKVNNYTFGSNDGFPTTGFTGAYFQLEINNSTARNTAYEWSSDAPDWVDVTNGLVKFIMEPTTKNEVTITAKSKENSDVLTYSFNVSYWFISNGTIYMKSSEVDNWCLSQPGGYQTPAYSLITNTTYNNSSGFREVGAFWTEWGVMNYYSVGFPIDQSWSSDYLSSNQRYTVGLTTGYLQSISIENNNAYSHVICVRPL